MGDVGALALGAALGTIAVIVRQEIVLFIMGGVFVAETLSVMLQVVYFKLDRRQAHLPHGAAAPPLRARGLEGDPGRGALLDHHHDAGAVRPVDAEARDDARAAFTLPPPAMRCRQACPGARPGRYRPVGRALGGTPGRQGTRRRYPRGAAAHTRLHGRAAHGCLCTPRCSRASTSSASVQACRLRAAARAGGTRARHSGGGRHRALRLARTRASRARDHRHQRQDHGDGAHRPPAARRRDRLRGRGQHRAAGARRADAAPQLHRRRRRPGCWSSPATSWKPPGRSSRTRRRCST